MPTRRNLPEDFDEQPTRVVPRDTTSFAEPLLTKEDPAEQPEIHFCPLAPIRKRIILLNSGLIVALVVLSLSLWSDTAELLQEYRATKRERQACRVIDAPPPPIEHPEIPTEDRVSKKRAYLGDTGTQRNTLMMLSLEQVGEDQEVRLGSPNVLAPNTVHIINLWGPFCGPCKEEFPVFRKMFERRAKDWGENIQFVPIQVQDNTPPETAYKQYERLMPQTTRQLADRSLNNELITDLGTATATKDVLYHGLLPVTLVLDCNRRIRWAHFEALKPDDFQDLEKNVDKMLSELNETGPTAWCQKSWCGNGRCEPQDRGENYCEVDCGPKPKTQQTFEESRGTHPVEDVEPIEKKIWALKGAPPKRKQIKKVIQGCGDGTCSQSESAETCCQDCPCSSNYVCQADLSGDMKCLSRLKR